MSRPFGSSLPATLTGSDLEPLALATGGEFLRLLVRSLRQALELDFVFAGEVVGDELDHVRTLAVATREGEGEGFEYALQDTPCERVVAGQTCKWPSDVAAEFPRDLMLADMGIEAYVGVPVHDGGGRPLGILVGLSRRPLPAAEAAVQTLGSWSSRIAETFESRRLVREMRYLVEGTTVPSSEGVFRALVRFLGRALHVRVAFIAERSDSADTSRLLAACVDGEIASQHEGLVCDHRAVPAPEVYRHGTYLVSEGLLDRYPCDQTLRDLGVVSYLGMAISGESGQPIGHFGIVHDRPLKERLAFEPVFRVVAARASVELRRLRAECGHLRAENRLQETQRIESLGVLAGGLAHDLNNLLVSVLGHAQLAQLEPERHPEHLAAVEGAGRRAAEVVQELLAFAGRTTIDRRDLDLNELVRETLRILRPSLPQHVPIELQLAPTLVPVRADASRIRQVVMNLVLNAAEAVGPTQGRVFVRTRSEWVDPDRFEDVPQGHDLIAGPHHVLEIEDEGVGMAPEVLGRIFDPFFSTKAGGRGLGLAAVLGIVRAHEGALDIQSEKHAGSIFRLFLPQGSEVGRGSGGSSWRGQGKILLADDEELVRMTGRKMLEALGFEVLVAEHGMQALDLFARSGQDVRAVLLDRSLPHVGEREVLRRMREVRPDLRILLLCGNGGAPAPEFEDDPFVTLLRKPFGLEDLRRTLRVFLS